MRAPLALLPAALLAVAALPADAVVAPGAEVAMLARQFLPAVVAVPSGGTLTFRNLEPVDLHHPTAADNSFSMHLNPGDSFTVTIAAPAGSQVAYRCLHHPAMAGVIVVV